MGITKQEIMSTVDTTHRMVHFSFAELVLMNNALNEILHGPDAIAAAEFQTRTGVCIEEAEALLTRIGKALEAMHAH